MPRTSGTKPDMVLAFDPTSENGHVAIYVNGHEPRFPAAVTAVFTLARPHLTSPIFVGLSAHEDTLETSGVTIIVDGTQT